MREVALKSVISIIRNGLNTTQYDEPIEPDMLPISRIETIWNGTVDLERIKYASVTNAQKEKYLLHAGDILFSHINSPAHIGKTALVQPNQELLHGVNLLLLRPKHDLVNSRYLNYYLKSIPVRKYFRVRCKKAVNQASLNQGDITQIKIPIPPLPEQERIAALLDKADRLRRLRRYALQLGDSYLQSVFLEMFGDPVTNPMGWEVKPLRSIATKFSDGPFGSNLKTSHYTPTGIRVIRLQNIGVGQLIDDDKAYISEDHFASLQKHKCVPGDVIVATLGDPNLRAIILSKSIPVALNKADCVQIRPNPKVTNIDFVCWLINHPSTLHIARALLHGQTRTRISMGQLKQLEVPIPPLPIQEKFAQIVQRYERLRLQQRESLRQAEHLFQALLHQAFEGKRDGQLEDQTIKAW